MTEASTPIDNPKDEEIVAGQVENEQEMCRLKLETIFLKYGFNLHNPPERSGGECCWTKNYGRADFSYIQYHWGPLRGEKFKPKEGVICLTACRVSLQEMVEMLEPTGQFRVEPYITPQGEARGLFWVYPIGD